MIPAPSRAGRAGCGYRRLSADERETIGFMVAAGAADVRIAEHLGRHPSTIARERKRHANRDGSYRPSTAHKRAEVTARISHCRPSKLTLAGPLRDYVVAGLRQHWSPQEIAKRIRMDHAEDPGMRVCAQTIYRSLFVQARGGLKRELTVHLRTQRQRRVPRARSRTEERRGKLVGTIPISQRPAEANDRAVPGHWEGDLIVGRDNGSAIGTLVERASRYVLLIHLPGRRTAVEFYEAIVPTINALPVGAEALPDLGQRQGDGHAPRHHHGHRDEGPLRRSALTLAARLERTPTGCCASTSPKASACASSTPTTSPRSRSNSTAAHAKPWTGTPPPRSSMTCSDDRSNHRCCVSA